MEFLKSKITVFFFSAMSFFSNTNDINLLSAQTTSNQETAILSFATLDLNVDTYCVNEVNFSLIEHNIVYETLVLLNGTISVIDKRFSIDNSSTTSFEVCQSSIVAEGIIAMDEDVMRTDTKNPNVPVLSSEVFTLSGESVFFTLGCGAPVCEADLAHLPRGKYDAFSVTTNGSIYNRITLD